MSRRGLTTAKHTSIVALSAVTTVAVVCAFVACHNDQSSALATPVAPRWTMPTRACSRSTEQASAYAEQRMRVGQRRWERAVFDSVLAVAALHDVLEAVACYQRVDDQAAAHGAQQVASLYYGRIVHDYARQQLRLRIAINRRNRDAIVDAASAVRALLPVRDASYLRWLEAVERSAQSSVVM